MSPTVPLAELDAQSLAHLASTGAGVSNLYRVLGNHPVLLRAWVDFAWTLRGRVRTPRRLRELMILRAAQLAGSAYMWDDHTAMALEAGVRRSQIESIGVWATSSHFDDEERLLLRFTDQVIAGHASDDVLGALRARYDADELVELAITAAFYVMVPRVLDVLRVPRDDAGASAQEAGAREREAGAREEEERP